MGRMGVEVYARPLRYRNQIERLPDGRERSFLASEEEGIDVRIALDVIRLALRDRFDVGVIFSQDQDFSEVAAEIRTIAQEHDRWTKIASAFPVGPACRHRRGIDKRDWIRLERATYDACLDRRDYSGQPGREVP